MRVQTRFERKTQTLRPSKPNKYADLAPSAQKNTAGQRRKQREEAQRRARLAVEMTADGREEEAPVF